MRFSSEGAHHHPVEVVPYRKEHLGELLQFLSEQYPTSPQKGRLSFFQWRFRDNPLGSSLDDYHLVIHGNRIVGQLATIRDRIWAKGRWWDCCWLIDLMLAEEHRQPESMAALRLFQAMIRKCPLLLVTGAGPRLVRLYKALGWDYREVSGTYYAIRRPAALAALAQVSGEKAGAAASLLPLAGLGMTALQAVRNRWQASHGRSFAFSPLERFGEETARLSERALPSLRVTSHRSPDYLNWKFNQRPEGAHFVIAATRKGERGLAGYMAVKIMARHPHARWAEIVDFLGEPTDREVIPALLQQATRQALDLDVDFLRLRCSLPEHQALLQPPFWIHRNRAVIDGVFFRTADKELAHCLANEPWHLTSLVSDRTDHGADEYAANRTGGTAGFFPAQLRR